MECTSSGRPRARAVALSGDGVDRALPMLVIEWATCVDGVVQAEERLRRGLSVLCSDDVPRLCRPILAIGVSDPS